MEQIDRVASALANRFPPIEQAEILQHLIHQTEKSTGKISNLDRGWQGNPVKNG